MLGFAGAANVGEFETPTVAAFEVVALGLADAFVVNALVLPITCPALAPAVVVAALFALAIG